MSQYDEARLDQTSTYKRLLPPDQSTCRLHFQHPQKSVFTAPEGAINTLFNPAGKTSVS